MPSRYGVLRRLKRQTTARSIQQESKRLTSPRFPCRGAGKPYRAGRKRRPLQRGSSSRRTSAAPAASASSLPRATLRASGTIPQLVHGCSRSAGTQPERPLERRGDLVRRLDPVGRDVDRADQHVLAVEQPDQLDRHVRVGAFQRHLVDARAGEQRKRLLVLPPLAAQRLLPIDVRLDAVAVADVNRGLATQPLRSALERRARPSRALRRNRR